MYANASRRPAAQSGRGKTYFVIPIRNGASIYDAKTLISYSQDHSLNQSVTRRACLYVNEPKSRVSSKTKRALRDINSAIQRY